jgi:hypothetical protein
MKPLLPPGCLLRIAPILESPRVGDIVLYQLEGGKLISHRVIAKTSDQVQTRGDAFAHPDGPVDLPQLLGKVTALEEPFRIPLDNRFARWTGRLLASIYPKLFKMKAAVRGRPSLQGVQDA